MLHKCTQCGKKFPRTHKYFYKFSGMKDGLASFCKSCSLLISRKYNLKSQYNMTIEDYDKMLMLQGGVCAICRKPETYSHYLSKQVRRLSVDHNHITGEVRGLLCHKCNLLIGGAEDSIDILYSTIEYLKETEGDRNVV